MSAIGGKADMTFCTANVCLRPKADIGAYLLVVGYSNQNVAMTVACYGESAGLGLVVFADRRPTANLRVTRGVYHENLRRCSLRQLPKGTVRR